jgi:hypothetical protein
MEETLSLYTTAPGAVTAVPEPLGSSPPSTTAAPVVSKGWVQEQNPYAVGVSSPFADRRIVVRLSTGEELVAGGARSASEAAEVGRDVVRRIADAESAGEWPEIDGHFVRPDTIVSVDVEVAL